MSFLIFFFFSIALSYYVFCHHVNLLKKGGTIFKNYVWIIYQSLCVTNVVKIIPYLHVTNDVEIDLSYQQK